MIKIREFIPLPPSCTFCDEFRYKKGAEKLYRCKVQCIKTNDLFEMFEDCPYLEKKFAVRETVGDD